MLNLIGLLAMLTAVVFGGGGLTVAAAQASLPDQVLYPVKTLSEDVWQSFATSPEAQFDLSLKLAERRISEFEELTRRQQPISVETAANLELHLQNAVRLATQGSPTENQEKLLRIRTTLETQTRALT